MKPRIAIVVAMARNGVIGANGELPWRLSSDLKRFKALTMGRPIVMGRKTWDSLPGLLPGRPHIVVTRDEAFRAEGADVAHSLDAALDRARIIAGELGVDEIAIIGGGQIYAETIGRADLLHVTHVEADVGGETRFPAIDFADWEPVQEEALPADEKNAYSTRYVLYRRRQQ